MFNRILLLTTFALLASASVLANTCDNNSINIKGVRGVIQFAGFEADNITPKFAAIEGCGYSVGDSQLCLTDATDYLLTQVPGKKDEVTKLNHGRALTGSVGDTTATIPGFEKAWDFLLETKVSYCASFAKLPTILTGIQFKFFPTPPLNCGPLHPNFPSNVFVNPAGVPFAAFFEQAPRRATVSTTEFFTVTTDVVLFANTIQDALTAWTLLLIGGTSGQPTKIHFAALTEPCECIPGLC